MNTRCWILAKVAVVDDALQIIEVRTASEGAHTITHDDAGTFVELFHEEGEDYGDARDMAVGAYNSGTWWQPFAERFPLP